MLSRTAENIFWMARYIERAESTARLIQMGQRMTILPGPIHREEWRSVLRVTGCDALIEGGRSVSEADIVRLLLLDDTNPSSIRSCMMRARGNGRAVRTALTQDMWEALNDDWRRLESYDTARARRDLPELLDWVKTRASTFRGAAETGQLRNEGHDFLRIGGALERAEMTLRLLDVKYYVLLPETSVVGGGRDHYQWTSVLHALSAARAYHHVYGGGSYTPWRIADLLILNRQFPRSVAFCFGQIGWHLERLADAHGGNKPPHDTVAMVRSELRDRENGEIFEEGLHEFVQTALSVTNRLSREIAQAYHFN